MRKMNFSKKILLVLISSIAFTILFSFFFLHFLYSELYIKSIEESIVYQGKRTASHYHYGELSDEIIEKIQWYNIVSEYEIIAVDNVEQLTTFFPYKINTENLIDSTDIERLEKGQYVMKNGYVEELNREIIGAVFPILGEQQLLGFIYIYVPLAAIQDVFQQSIPLLSFVGTIFFLVLFIIINKVWVSLFEPLRELQQLSKDVSKGDFSGRIHVEQQDEVGELAEAFNLMSRSLEEQEQRKKEFTSNVVHEIRTPLTYIGGYAHALETDIYRSPEEAKNYLQIIQKETERLSKLMNDLVELNHLQEDMYRLKRQPTAIAQVLIDTIELFTIQLQQKKLQLVTEIDEEIIFSADEKRIQQVFYNTIDNAIKYASEQSILTISLAYKKGYIVYQIINQGEIISPEDLVRIGERFFRTDKARTRTTGGTGLGLSIVKEIVRLHEGEFSMMSSEEKGTVVKITFPLEEQEEEEWGQK